MQLPTTIRSPIRSSLAEYARMRLTPARASSVNFMSLKYPLVYELVIVIADLYLPEEGSAGILALPGLERIARFGRVCALHEGWRAWLARRVGAEALAAEAPACVAARCNAARGALWLAAPVHCVAGLSSVHLDYRGLLKLPMATLAALAEDFQKLFQGSGFALQPLASGGFLLSGPAGGADHATEPARSVGGRLAGVLPGEPALRRLGAEIELWLHEHPVNRLRARRGELPVTGLWIWGGGTLPRELALPAAHEPVTSARAYGRDPYLDGLWCARGAQVQPLPAVIEEVLAAPTQLSVSIVELAELLTLDPAASLGDALAACDARWLAPAVRLVERGAVQQVAVVANDRCLSLQRYDHLKRWRRARRGLAGLA